jgi:DNA repair protein RecO (recombination protein O)
MFHQTEGIVLRTLPYGDNGFIAHIYTRSHGMQGYFLRGMRSKKSKTPAALFQVPNLLELVVVHKEGHSLNQIREARMSHSLNTLRTDPVKSAIALFMAELIYKSLREEEQNAEAWEYVQTALLQLDTSVFSVANFHLVFMMKWTRLLGIYPNIENTGGERFSLSEGVYSYGGRTSETTLLPPFTDLWRQLQESKLDSCHELQLNGAVRRQLLQHLQAYYSFHLPGFGELKSPAVLAAVFT